MIIIMVIMVIMVIIVIMDIISTNIWQKEIIKSIIGLKTRSTLSIVV